VTCEYREDVAVHLLGGLPAREAVEIDRHVLGCDSCSHYTREMSIVRTLLDGLDPSSTGRPESLPVAAGPPADLAEVTVAQMLGRRQRRSNGDVRLFLAGVAAAVVLGVVPISAYTWTHRPAVPTQEYVGTAAAPNAWGEAKFHSRTDGTIIDFEAGDLPDPGGHYLVTVSAAGTLLAKQEFSAGADGWGQVLLATDRPITSRYAIDVQRLDGPHPVSVLRCQCAV
jgi:hypothetical protein